MPRSTSQEAILFGQTKRIVAKLTNAGRRTLRRSRRRVLRLSADVPGESVRVRKLTLR